MNPFDGLGIGRGDLILIHSCVARIARLICPERPQDCCGMLVAYLIDKVGPEGTLIFPTFNFGFCSGKPFSIKATPSTSGTLTNYVLGRPDAVRTKHPIYSFAVIGRDARDLASIDHVGSFSEDSIFGEIRRRDGKIMLIDLPYRHGMTFLHHVEETQGVHYRYQKVFSGTYIDQEGRASQRSYSMFVRNLDMGVTTDIEPMSELFEQGGYVKKVTLKAGVNVKIMQAKELYKFGTEFLMLNPNGLWKPDKDRVLA